MHVIINHYRIVNDYFRAWIKFDKQLVRKLFDENAKYVIKPSNKVLHGHPEIISYWERNKKRQRNLKIRWGIISYNNRKIIIRFKAIFFDLEDNESQLIKGIINLYIKGNGKIFMLSESYRKISLLENSDGRSTNW